MVDNVQIQRIVVGNSPHRRCLYLSTTFSSRLHLVVDNNFSSSVEALTALVVRYTIGPQLLGLEKNSRNEGFEMG